MPQEFAWATVVDYAKRRSAKPPVTQYELPGVTEESHDGVPVAVVPLWHAVVTARLAFPATDRQALRVAQRRLTVALTEVEEVYPLDPSGIFIQVAYGLPYFRNRLPTELTEGHMPRSAMPGTESQWAIVDAVRFPRDPEDLVLENHEICFHFKSDYREHIENVIDTLFHPGGRSLNGIPASSAYVGDLFVVTTIRRGFAGRGMPKKIGTRLGIPGAEHIPDGAMLFMGFTSSHIHGLAQGNLPSFETIPGYTDLTPGSYFAGGTAMHLSHITIKLDEWYRFGPRERLHRMFDPRRTDPPEVLSPDQSPATSSFERERDADAQRYGLLGHNEQMQFLSRIARDTTTAYGQKLARGTVFFLRQERYTKLPTLKSLTCEDARKRRGFCISFQDFDTVENPFSFSLSDAISAHPRAGVHVIGFGPSAQHFEKLRREMDGVEQQQRYGLREENLGFTTMLVTTHRQNFLLPPRAHRSMPLAEML